MAMFSARLLASATMLSVPELLPANGHDGRWLHDPEMDGLPSTTVVDAKVTATSYLQPLHHGNGLPSEKAPPSVR